MKLEEFKEGMKNNNAVRISQRYVVWNDYELQDELTKKWTRYGTLENLCEKKPEIKNIIEGADDFTIFDSE